MVEVQDDGGGKIRKIDIVALNEKAEEILFMECKWKELKEKDAGDIIKELKGKSGYVNWNNDKRKEFYGIIASPLVSVRMVSSGAKGIGSGVGLS